MASTTKSYPMNFQPQDGGLRLSDGEFIRNSIINLNTCSATYGITAIGSTQATAQPLSSVLNQIDTASASTGVNLPLSTGKHTTPYQFCIIVNNTANTVSIYGAQGSSDTVNGTAGSTAQSLLSGATALFNSVKPGSWFSGDINDAGTFTSINSSGNLTFTAINAGVVQKQGSNGKVGTFVLNGTTTVTISNTSIAITDAIIISLNAVGGTVGVQPHVSSITAATGFTVIGTASDTSTYNYSIISSAA